jgi:cyclic pyranopterin phosphate synthase
MALRDLHGRPLANLRLSVTDRCNLRCAYCMPDDDYRWLEKAEILRFEELALLVEAFCDAGVERVRLTGGEPLLRRDLDQLVALLAANPRLSEVALTTNGVLLAEQARGLRAAGLTRVTVSLDTLDRAVFERIARRDELARVLEGLEVAARTWRAGLKIDTVVMRGVNDGELEALLAHGRRLGAEVRFIEYMDVGGATRWSPDQVVPAGEILAHLTRRFGPIEPAESPPSAPADRYRLPDGTVFGLITSTTAPFCGACDRSRLTADGQWYLCLYARLGVDLRALLRSGAGRAAIRERIEQVWRARSDRGAEERLRQHERAPLLSREALRADPHLEMHTRGG